MFQDTYELDFETIRGELAAKHNMLFNFALQDLDAGAYADMVAAKPLPPSEAQELPDIEAEAEDLGTDDWGSAVEALPVEPRLHEPKPQGKNRHISRPMR